MRSVIKEQKYGDARREAMVPPQGYDMGRPYRGSIPPHHVASMSPMTHLHSNNPGPSAYLTSKSVGPTPSYRSVSEVIAVPIQLENEVGDPKFKPVLLRVKEQSGINYVTVNRRADGTAENIIVDAPDTATALLAKNLIETHMKQMQKLNQASQKLHEIQNNLFMVQGEMASYMTAEFTVKPALVGYVIGKKGARIKETIESTGVATINVDGDTGRVTIHGPDGSSVQKAREILDIEDERHDLEERHADYYIRERDDSLNDLRATSGLLLARLDKDNSQMVFVGSKHALKAARLLLNTQLSYVDRMLAMDDESRETRKQLHSIKQQYLGIGGRERPTREKSDREKSDRDRSDRKGKSNEKETVSASSITPASTTRNTTREKEDRNMKLSDRPAASTMTAVSTVETKKGRGTAAESSTDTANHTKTSTSVASVTTNMTNLNISVPSKKGNGPSSPAAAAVHRIAAITGISVEPSTDSKKTETNRRNANKRNGSSQASESSTTASKAIAETTAGAGSDGNKSNGKAKTVEETLKQAKSMQKSIGDTVTPPAATITPAVTSSAKETSSAKTVEESEKKSTQSNAKSKDNPRRKPQGRSSEGGATADPSAVSSEALAPTTVDNKTQSKEAIITPTKDIKATSDKMTSESPIPTPPSTVSLNNQNSNRNPRSSERNKDGKSHEKTSDKKKSDSDKSQTIQSVAVIGITPEKVSNIKPLNESASNASNVSSAEAAAASIAALPAPVARPPLPPGLSPPPGLSIQNQSNAKIRKVNSKTNLTTFGNKAESGGISTSSSPDITQTAPMSPPIASSPKTNSKSRSRRSPAPTASPDNMTNPSVPVPPVTSSPGVAISVTGENHQFTSKLIDPTATLPNEDNTPRSPDMALDKRVRKPRTTVSPSPSSHPMDQGPMQHIQTAEENVVMKNININFKGNPLGMNLSNVVPPSNVIGPKK